MNFHCASDATEHLRRTIKRRVIIGRLFNLVGYACGAFAVSLGIIASL